MLDFTDCAGMKLCKDPPLANPLQVVTCGPGTVQKVSGMTNPQGEVVLQVVGAGTGVGNGPSVDCTKLLVTPPAGGPAIFFSTESAVLYDPNGASGAGGANGVSAIDLSYARADLKDQLAPPNGTNTFHSRSDYSSVDGCSGAGDCGAPMTALDIAFFRAILKASTVAPVTGSGGGCPDILAPAGPDYCP